MSTVPFQLIPIIGLCCNLVVVLGNCYSQFKTKTINFKEAFPYIVSSIPASFLGGTLSIQKETLLTLLGTALLIASIGLILPMKEDKQLSNINPNAKCLIKILLGGGIGFLSGILGIGGGIFLAPCIYFLRFTKTEHVPSITSLFIFINSLSALAGHSLKMTEPWTNQTTSIVIIFLLCVIAGSFIGNKLRLKLVEQKTLKKITGVVILIASIKLLLV
jgi:uncharacterized protein